jgi:ubiquinone/menaquinone biosynthesis C-methylase UbiE
MDEQTRQTYRQIAADFTAANQDRAALQPDLAAFAAGLPAGAVVVDVGCGPGFDTAVLRQQYQLQAIGLDYSHTMMQTGRHQYAWQFPLVQGDMRHLPFAAGSLHGIWACASLLHLPRAEMPAVLAHFARLLRVNGRFYLSVKQGDDAGYAPQAYGHDAPRYFTYWQPHTLDPLLAAAGFCPIWQKTNPAAKGSWLVRLLQLC